MLTNENRGYRLDIEEDAFSHLKDRADTFGIVPGDSKKSEVVRRISSSDDNLIMPPPESNLSLTQKERDLIIKWIDQGAKWKKHWSFIPLKATAVPKTNSASWTKNEIDHFVARKLDEKGLSASKPATKERLLRRLSFDPYRTSSF